MKIVTSKEAKIIDSATCQVENITSLELMDRAAQAFVDRIVVCGDIDHSHVITVLCGFGNNGGDGVAIAGLLCKQGFQVDCRLYAFNHELSSDCAANVERLKKLREERLDVNCSFNEYFDWNNECILFHKDTIFIDALFGSGLNRVLEKPYTTLIDVINKEQASVLSVDIPSGLFGEDNGNNNRGTIIKASKTFTFQLPKLSFLFPENSQNVGQWSVLDIGLNKDAINNAKSNWHLITYNSVKTSLPKANNFAHKGTNGKIAIVAGHGNMVGAAILASLGALHSGAGLIHVFLPKIGIIPLLSNMPEAIPHPFESDEFDGLENPDSYDAVLVGPGLGTGEGAYKSFQRLLKEYHGRIIVDADALNILSEHKELLELLKNRAILTPHPKEFERLAGKWLNDFERLNNLSKFAVCFGVCVILKDAYTTIALPDGRCLFNPTGNPGLAKGGSGDVLSGVLTALLPQKALSPEQVAAIGVYVHGYSADIQLEQVGVRGVTPSLVAKGLGYVWKHIEEKFIKPKW